MVLITDMALIVFTAFTNKIIIQIAIIKFDIKNKFSDFKNTEINSIGINKTGIKLSEKPVFRIKLK
ncbi:MAG: hypothetical protein KAJ48_04930 [Elusimicrobiales bacterium]|nr:hypothetical protein [Elusimicrobiales bacterium]